MPIPLASGQIGPDEAGRLQSLGFETVEEVIAAAEVVSHELSRFLGRPVSEVLKPVMGLAQMPSAAVQQQLAELPCELGAELADRAAALEIPLDLALVAPPSGPVPAHVNYAPLMPPILDQQNRGTCVAFASLAAYEHYLSINGSYRDMSEQFLYWNCKQNDGIPLTEGTWVRIAFRLLQRDGCCEETDWPYNPNPMPGNVSQGPPPPGSQRKALPFRIAGYVQIPPTSVQDIKNVLLAQRCVAFSVPVYNSWYLSTYVRLTGDITNPVPGEMPVGGHAMCIVGFIDLPNRPELGGGRFILRNSWGAVWGQQSSYGRGYGTIPCIYIGRWGVEAFSIV